MKMDAKQAGFARRERRKVKTNLGNEGQGAFRAGQQRAEIEIRPARGERRGLHQQVEGIARIAPFYGSFREFAPDGQLVVVIAQHGPDLPVEPAFGTRVLATAVKLFRLQLPEGRLGAIAQERFYFEEMFAGAAVNDRVGSTRIVADHAADHGAVGGGSLGPEHEAVRLQEQVQFIADDARLDPYPTFRRIELQYPCEMFGNIHHYPAAHYLARQ